MKATTGYVVLRPAESPTEILIMNTPDVNTSTKIWRWNMNGFAYSSKGINGPYGTAITMDGAIVADFITAGILSANLIKAGTMSLSRLFGDDLVLGGNNNRSGRLIIKDVNAVEKIIADNEGLKIINGAKLFGSDGVLSNFQFHSKTNSNGASFIGFRWEYEEYLKERLVIDAYIPENFHITSAKITLMHRPVYWNYTDMNTDITKYAWGWARNLKLYKMTNLNSMLQVTAFGGDIFESYFDNLLEISSAFGANGFTASTPSSSSCKMEMKESIDIKNYLSVGRNILVIQTSNSAPAAGTLLEPKIDGYIQTGEGDAVLNITGFIS